MEHFVNEVTVMQYYIDQMDADKINFLQGKEEKKKVIRGLIVELMEEDKMNYKIQIACKLWKELFDASMSFISPDKQGYDKLFKYFDAYVEFEELIFASDSFYRDHTLHCIWVYFLGEYIRREEKFNELFVDADSQRKMIEGIENVVSDIGIMKQGRDSVTMNYAVDIMKKMDRYSEAARCVEALTHDLGYPLKKIEKINKSIHKVLPYFAINDADEFSFEYTNVQQEYVNDFIDFLSRNFRVAINFATGEEKEAEEVQRILETIFETNENGTVYATKTDVIANLTEEERNMIAGKMTADSGFLMRAASKLGFLNDFEDYKHGIMSAFLLFKNLRTFQNIDYDKLKDDLIYYKSIRNEKVVILNNILGAISNHTNDMFRIEYLTDGEYLTFVDELEEFSRISRASQNREYVKEFCDTALYMEDGWFNIVFEFSNTELDNLDPEISFRGRCKRFLTLFNVPDLSPNLKLRVTCVGKLPTDQNTYVLEIATKHAKIMINGEEQNIPKYLKSNQFYTTEEYATL